MATPDKQAEQKQTVSQPAPGSTLERVDSDGQEPRVRKQLRLSHVDNWKAVELFEREADILETLDHPGIPTYYGSDTEEIDDDLVFTLTRDYLPGEALAERIAARAPRPAMDEAALRDFLAQMLDILAYLHDINPPVVHRDITPEHIIVEDETDEDGESGPRYRLIGFGSVQAVLPQTRGGSTFVGTRGYMPVEQMMGRATPASDLYGLGATALALVTGLQPDNLRGEDGKFDLDAHVDLLPDDAGLRTFLASLVEPEPQHRPDDALAARRRFERLASLVEAGRFDLALLDDPPPEIVTTSRNGEALVVELDAVPTSRTEKIGLATLGGLGILTAIQAASGMAPLYIVFMLAFLALGAVRLMWRTRHFTRLAVDTDTLTVHDRRPGWADNRLTLANIDAFDWKHDADNSEWYRVVAEIDGDTEVVARRLRRDHARWLTDTLEDLRHQAVTDAPRFLS